MEKAMSRLDKEGIFGKKHKREEVTLFLTVSDSFMQEEVEEQSAKRLNSLAVYEKFKNRYA